MENKEVQSRLIAQRIIELADQNGLSINKLASRANMTQSTLSGIINYGRIPNISTIYSICETLNITTQEFFDFYPYNKKNTPEGVLSR